MDISPKCIINRCFFLHPKYIYPTYFFYNFCVNWPFNKPNARSSQNKFFKNKQKAIFLYFFTENFFTPELLHISICFASFQSNKGEVVVVGGSLTNTSTEVYDVENGRWRRGPDLPVPIRGAGTVQLNDGFILTGGETKITKDIKTTTLNTLYRYSSQKWIELPQKLSVSRAFHVSLLVNFDF